MKIQFAETIHAPNAPLFIRLTMLVWEHLPVLLFADLLLYIAAIPAIIVWVIGFPLLAPWVAACMLGPVWTGISAIANKLVNGEEASWLDLLKAIRQHWYTAMHMSVIIALIVTIFIGTWSIMTAYPHITWLYLPLFIDGCVVMLMFLASLSAFSLATAYSLRGWTMWKVSLAATRLQLGKTLGIIASFMVLGLLLVILNVGLVPLLFAPLAICLSRLTRQTCESLSSPLKHE